MLAGTPSLQEMWRGGDEEGFEDEEENDDMDEDEEDEDEDFFQDGWGEGWGGVEQFPRPSFCRIRGGVIMLRPDHVDTMFKVAAGSWTNQD